VKSGRFYGNFTLDSDGDQEALYKGDMYVVIELIKGPSLKGRLLQTDRDLPHPIDKDLDDDQIAVVVVAFLLVALMMIVGLFKCCVVDRLLKRRKKKKEQQKKLERSSSDSGSDEIDPKDPKDTMDTKNSKDDPLEFGIEMKEMKK